MKKIGILFFVALLVVAFTMPAAALENVFGGYWRTRFIIQNDFTGEDLTGADDVYRVDTRTRIYYTAILNDNLKLVNKFEFDAVWGDTGYGDIGADGVLVEIKNSYADFNLGPINAKIGVQGTALSRGFLFDDDFAGANVAFKSDSFSFPIIWIKAVESTTAGTDADDQDMYVLNPSFNIGDSVKINPIFTYVTEKLTNTDVYFLGVNVDAGPAWFSGLYQTGDISDTIDVSAFLVALGGSFNFGAVGVNSQVFYATGDDNADNTVDAFTAPPGQAYYWSEIMGRGTFDNQVSANSPGHNISDVLAANIGASFKPADSLKLSLNLWYATLAEDDAAGNNVLGTEIDFKATYTLVEGMNLDIIAAYLLAGEATYDGPDDANALEVGTRLSLSF